jgi:8-hydroxy-5-deazaflavin:NADPH oxidoreductase
MMKIGIIGSGNMGRSLGMLWAEQGLDMLLGVNARGFQELLLGFSAS